MAMSILCLYRDFYRGGDHGKVLFIVFLIVFISELILFGKRDLGPNGTRAQMGHGPKFGPAPKSEPGPNGTQAQIGPGPKWDPGPNRARAQMGPGP